MIPPCLVPSFCAHGPPNRGDFGQMRRNKERVRLTEWNVGFYKHTTLERVRHEIRTYLLESAFQHDCGRERFLAVLQVRLVETNPY